MRRPINATRPIRPCVGGTSAAPSRTRVAVTWASVESRWRPLTSWPGRLRSPRRSPPGRAPRVSSSGGAGAIGPARGPLRPPPPTGSSGRSGPGSRSGKAGLGPFGQPADDPGGTAATQPEPGPRALRRRRFETPWQRPTAQAGDGQLEARLVQGGAAPLAKGRALGRRGWPLPVSPPAASVAVHLPCGHKIVARGPSPSGDGGIATLLLD